MSVPTPITPATAPSASRPGEYRPQPLLVLAQRALLAPPLGDVACVDDQLGRVPGAHTRLAHGFEHPPGAVVRAEPELRGLGDARVVDRRRQSLRHDCNVIRVDVVERVALEQLPGGAR